ncbi:unnamed protein product [Triticum turgidum subsp. durum]|uniref:Uncharacterized protein n=1 Tax=Triticum turgidum subsp. durum TaxID=4567 RepID=A0A9R0Y7Z7_TRITD|nr:unnamed protein product [Triticum turgidum subsp. durum]
MPSPPSVNGANVSASTSSVWATSQSLLGSMFMPSSIHTSRLKLTERALAAKPPLLCLAIDAASAQFSAPAADRQQQLPPPSPSPSAHMSATALLQKAAQMGATSSSSSFLRGLGLDISSSSPMSTSSGQHQQQHHHHQEPMQMEFPEGSLQQWPPRLEPEPAPMMSAGLGLGLPYDSTDGPMGLPELMMGQSSLFSAKSATLDFLGLGMSPTGATTSRGLPVFMQPMGGAVGMARTGSGVAETFGFGRGAQAKPWERNPSSSPIL